MQLKNIIIYYVLIDIIYLTSIIYQSSIYLLSAYYLYFFLMKEEAHKNKSIQGPWKS